MITKEQIIDIARDELTPIGWHEEHAKYIDGLDAFAERLVKLCDCKDFKRKICRRNCFTHVYYRNYKFRAMAVVRRDERTHFHDHHKQHFYCRYKRVDCAKNHLYRRKKLILYSSEKN